ncbi:MAG: hypothetical protein LBR79_04310 [Oscillospiraceae bacterium]|jgi:hypothetical protein|nr:hypothetical protein [Oscillospiraceae bacterium]
MSFFKKNEAEKQEQPKADDKITIEDLAYMVYQIAEKVGVDFSNEDEEGKENKSEEGDGEEHKEGEISSSINDFLLSKGLTADEIRDVEEYYKQEGEDILENEADDDEGKENGGYGSGDFDHSGRPGEVGGSGSGGRGSAGKRQASVHKMGWAKWRGAQKRGGIKWNEGEGQPDETEEKELEKELKEEKQNSADSSKTSKIREAQRNEIKNSASPSYCGVSTERERAQQNKDIQKAKEYLEEFKSR